MFEPLPDRDVLFHWMCANLNIPYKWGGDDPSGYDCSGIVQEFYKIVNLDPPGDQTADAYYRHFIVVKNSPFVLPITKTRIKFGDMLFFGRDNHATHIAVSVNCHIMFEAAGGGRNTLTEADAKRDNAFARFRSIVSRNDLIGCGTVSKTCLYRGKT